MSMGAEPRQSLGALFGDAREVPTAGTYLN